MKILVTGAAGFIGYHLIKALAEEGHELVGLDNLNTYYDIRLKQARLKQLGIDACAVADNQLLKSNRYSSFRFVKMDLTDNIGLDKLFEVEQFQVVCNLAAQAGVRYSIDHPETYIESNLVGFFRILEACRRFHPQHFIYASSSSVYGMNQKVPYAESDQVDSPVSLYAATKKSDELMSFAYSKLYGIPTTGLRFFTVYGPWGRPDMAPIKFMRAIVNEKPIQVFNEGHLSRDFTYIDDIVQGILRIIQNPPLTKAVPNEIYNIGHSSPVSLMEFIETIETIVGKKAIKQMLPMQPGDVYQTYADTTLLQKRFGYCANTSLNEGLDKLYQWYKEYSDLLESI